MQLSLSQPGFARLSRLLSRFGQWWLKEFLNLFPERYLELFSGRGRALVAIAAGEGGITLELLNGALASTASERMASAGNALVEIDRFLIARRLERRGVDIGVPFPAGGACGPQRGYPCVA